MSRSSSAPTGFDQGVPESQVLRFDTVLGTMIRVDVDPPNDTDFLPVPSMSDDGRFVLFDTKTALVPSDTDTFVDSYVRDLVTGTLALVNVDGLGRELFGGGTNLSGDGRYLAPRRRTRSSGTYHRRVRDGSYASRS